MLFVKKGKRKIEPRFRLFFLSSSLLLLGLCLLSFVEFYMPPSVKQEVLGLIALVIGAIGGLGTIIAYLAILWHRLRGFFTNHERE